MKTIVTEIPDYKTFFKGEKTVEIGYPWLTFGAIMAIEKILRDSKGKFRILEMGSGGSTIFFSQRCEYLLSLEHDPEWAIRVSRCLENPRNVECGAISRLKRIIRAEEDNFFDMILADSGAGATAYTRRLDMLKVALPKLKKGGWLILDNYEHMDFDYTGYDVYTFDMFHYSGRGTKLCRKL